MNRRISIGMVMSWVCLAGTSPALAEFNIQTGGRSILFGDTAFGQPFFTEWVDQFMFSRYPDSAAEVICFSDRKCDAGQGLRRIDAELIPSNPDEVIVCFGLDAHQRRSFEPAALDRFVTDMTKMVDRLRESGYAVVLVTPPPPDITRNRGLQTTKFDETVAKFAEAVRKLGADKQVPVLDWHKAVTEYNAKYTKGAKRHWTQDGVLPTGVGVALFTGLLLEHWQAEPLDYLVEVDWNKPEDATASFGSADAYKKNQQTLSMTLMQAPVGLNVITKGSIPNAEWPLTKWFQYRLKINNCPPGGLLLSSEGQNAKPFLSKQLLVGADVGMVGPLVENGTVKELHNAIRTKLNQFIKYRFACHRVAPHPELEEGYRLHKESERSLAFGAQQIVSRTPARFDIRIEVTTARRSAPPGGSHEGHNH